MKTPATSLPQRLVAGAVALMLLAVPIASAEAPSGPIVDTPAEAFHPVPSYASSRPAPVIYDTFVERPTGSRPVVGVPIPVSVVNKPVATVLEAPRPSHVLAGRASWYCGNGSPCAKGYPAGGSYAAAGPALRAAICGIQSCTSWRGRTVYVDRIPVRLIDWCQCYWHQSNEKIIDLYHSVFVQTGSSVTITWR